MLKEILGRINIAKKGRVDRPKKDLSDEQLNLISEGLRRGRGRLL
ncbi:MAG: hypothetical protein Q8N08_04400 [Methanobacteriaceae archaeon]|nr:hypothetical protein [Methanobacteriaceae archaeon]